MSTTSAVRGNETHKVTSSNGDELTLESLVTDSSVTIKREELEPSLRKYKPEMLVRLGVRLWKGPSHWEKAHVGH